MKKIQLQVSKPELGREQEVLRTGAGRGWHMGLEAPWWYRRELLGCGALNVSFMQPWDRASFRARLAPPGGRLPSPNPELGVLPFPW